MIEYIAALSFWEFYVILVPLCFLFIEEYLNINIKKRTTVWIKSRGKYSHII